jgi:hypothetical protein
MGIIEAIEKAKEKIKTKYGYLGKIGIAIRIIGIVVIPVIIVAWYLY